MTRLCCFYNKGINDCTCPYCYYETEGETDCPIKVDYINKTTGLKMSAPKKPDENRGIVYGKNPKQY